MSESESEKRRRLINLGELIALAALIVSAVGVWIAWKSSNQDKPTRVVEQKQSIPLSLRGTTDRDGSTLTIMPADPSHGLESLTVTIKGAQPIEVGSDGRLQASDVQSALKDRPKTRTSPTACRSGSRRDTLKWAPTSTAAGATFCVTAGKAAACSAADR
jgi:hypothetical protein